MKRKIYHVKGYEKNPLTRTEYSARWSFFRYLKMHELALHLKKPSAQVERWICNGDVNQLVLEKGRNEDLKRLLEFGVSFANNKWQWQTKPIDQYSTTELQERLELLFKGGWRGDSPTSVIFDTACYHPALLDLWKKNAPDFWRQRSVKLQQQLVFSRFVTPEQILAQLRLGATMPPEDHPREPNRMWYEPKISGIGAWLKENTTEQQIALFEAIDAHQKLDQSRRRVRDEHPHQAFPWSLFHQAAFHQGHIPTLVYLQTKHPLPWEKTWRYFLNTEVKPEQLWSDLKAHHFPVPTPTRKHAQTMIEDGVKLDKWDLIIELMNDGYHAELKPGIEDKLRQKAPPSVWAAWERHQIQHSTTDHPTLALSFVARPRL